MSIDQIVTRRVGADSRAPAVEDAVESFRSLCSITPLPSAVFLSRQHRLSYANAAFCKLVHNTEQKIAGLNVDDLLGAPWLPLFHRAYREASAQSACGAIKSKRCVTVYASPILTAGESVGLFVQLRIEKSVPTAVPSALELREANANLVVTAMASQAQAEQARSHAAEFEALLSSMSEGIIVFKEGGEIALINKVGSKLLGFDVDKPSLNDFRNCDLRSTAGEQIVFEEHILKPLLNGCAPTEVEIVIHAPNSAPRYLAVCGNLIRDAHGRAHMAILAFRDTTQAHEMQKLKERYIALISHDLRGPLTAAYMSVQMLERTADSDERQVRYTGRALRNLSKMDEMISTLLDAQRKRGGGLTKQELLRADLTEVVRDVIEDMTLQHGGRFAFLPMGRVEGSWNVADLRRAIWNLASNAIKYGDAFSPVTLSVVQHGGFVDVAVHNRGKPIAAHEQKRLFEPFEQLGLGQSVADRGWGLGLASVQDCAHAHGGDVKVTSSWQEGTTFTITVPIRL